MRAASAHMAAWHFWAKIKQENVVSQDADKSRGVGEEKEEEGSAKMRFINS